MSTRRRVREAFYVVHVPARDGADLLRALTAPKPAPDNVPLVKGELGTFGRTKKGTP